MANLFRWLGIVLCGWDSRLYSGIAYQRIGRSTLQPRRGLILPRNGMALAHPEAPREHAGALHTRTKYILVTSAFAIAWLLSIGCGFAVFARYNNKPGLAGAVPRSWPDLHLERSHDRPTLVMVAHPRCPCTRASIGELAQIMARQQGKLIAYVLFVKPGKADADWDETDLWRSARKIPGVTVLSDSDGVAASRLGAETSGHTFLFAGDGRLLFSGGITESRGHAGDNAGESAIVSLLNNKRSAQNQTFVFGCALAARSTSKQLRECLP